jgi:integrase
MIASGAGVKIVKQQLGHASAILTLDRYAHLLPDELDALERPRRTESADSRGLFADCRRIDALADITTRRLTGGDGCGAGRT